MSDGVSLSKLTLTKSAPSVSLSKGGSAHGQLRVNLNWTAKRRGQRRLLQEAHVVGRTVGSTSIWRRCTSLTDGTQGRRPGPGQYVRKSRRPALRQARRRRPDGSSAGRRDAVHQPRPHRRHPAHPRIRLHLRGRARVGSGRTPSSRCSRARAADRDRARRDPAGCPHLRDRHAAEHRRRPHRRSRGALHRRRAGQARCRLRLGPRLAARPQVEQIRLGWRCPWPGRRAGRPGRTSAPAARS